MLELHISEQEFFDERTNMFFTTRASTVKLAHSLISIAKWEGIWKKPYFPSRLHPGLHGKKEEVSYISCMMIGSYPEYMPEMVYLQFRNQIQDYINEDQTATTIHRLGPQTTSGPTITAEIIYYWMIKFQIPFECERWHFSRLLTLIDVCNVKENSSSKGNKMSAVDSAKYRQDLNRARRAAYDKSIAT